jgi:hypothetical protein
VHEFLGLTNLFTGDLRREVLAAGRNVKVTREPGLDDKGGAYAYVRPYDFDVSPSAEGNDWLAAELLQSQIVGNIVRLSFRVDGRVDPVRVEQEKERFRALGAGTGARLYLRPRHVQVFAGEGDKGWEI